MGRTTSGWWYVVAAVVAMVALGVTAAEGLGRVTDLVDEVESFQHFESPGGTQVQVGTPGRYAVFHEERLTRSGGPRGTFAVRVTGPDGTDVAVGACRCGVMNAGTVSSEAPGWTWRCTSTHTDPSRHRRVGGGRGSGMSTARVTWLPTRS